MRDWRLPDLASVEFFLETWSWAVFFFLGLGHGLGVVVEPTAFHMQYAQVGDAIRLRWSVTDERNYTRVVNSFLCWLLEL